MPSAVTGTGAVVAPAEKLAVGWTIARLVLVELRLTVRPPAGAFADRVRVKFWDEFSPTVEVEGDKVTVAVPFTGCVADV